MTNLNGINGINGLQPAPKPPAAADKAPGFDRMLAQAIEDVNQTHVEADQAVADLVAGKSQDIHNVMIATQKADVGFQLLMQVRNKIVGAYEQIMRMQI
ncbi:MAG: flagellar hook-basal body complex protein FliE [Desulfobacterales bacterium]|nr:flagellar hook-basal body complex protein FliE [Desulfobacterales bacterium]MDJ0856076.1 flagellar hook-basal body complex protein FliE [Desulfobacterales bacterium]MDJ0988535.1 flagellar hook-basal body complex protein FliE [Desulfobacterales bacterium]